MADGVFLWVFLVVRSLLRGLSDDDDIPTLQRRLRALPKDLRSWFRDILGNIDEIYQQYTACALLLACSSEGPLPILAISHIEVENDNQRFAIDASLDPMPTETYEAMLYNVRSIVNKWCRNLLEVRETRAIKVTQVIDKHKVDFLHRSVKDFLTEDETYTTLVQRAGKIYNPRLTLCRSLVAQTKALTIESENAIDLAEFRSWAVKALVYAHACEKVDAISPIEELDELDRVGNYWASRCGSLVKHWSTHTDNHYIFYEDFAGFAAEDDLQIYLAYAKKRSSSSSRVETHNKGRLSPTSPDELGSLNGGTPDDDKHREPSLGRRRDRFKMMFTRSPRSSQVDLVQDDNAYGGT